MTAEVTNIKQIDTIKQPLLTPNAQNQPLIDKAKELVQQALGASSPGPSLGLPPTPDNISISSIKLLSDSKVEITYFYGAETKTHVVDSKEFSATIVPQIKTAQTVLQQLQTTQQSKTVSTCLDQIIPASDKLAIYRNIAKLTISVASLILVILGCVGIANPLILCGIAVGISLLAIVTLFTLYKTGKISKRDFFLLSVMTLGILTAGASGGHYYLIALYSVVVLIQAVLFAIPQGAIGWGLGGWKNYQIAHKAGNTNGLSLPLQINSGITSFLEGSTWLAMGSLMFLDALHHIAGIPSLPPEILSWITTVLFLGIFNIGYVLMIATGLRNYLVQNKFHNELNALPPCNSKENCITVLNFLLRKMAGKKDLLAIDEKQLLKKQHRLTERMDDTAFALLKIDDLNKLLQELQIGINVEANIKICQTIISDIIASNARKCKFCRDTLRIGFAGLMIGSLLSLLEEFTNSGSVIHMPYIGDLVHCSDAVLSALPELSTIMDCSFWALMNYWFLTKLDAPPSRTVAEENPQQQIDSIKKTAELKIQLNEEIEKRAGEILQIKEKPN